MEKADEPGMCLFPMYFLLALHGKLSNAGYDVYQKQETVMFVGMTGALVASGTPSVKH